MKTDRILVPRSELDAARRMSAIEIAGLHHSDLQNFGKILQVQGQLHSQGFSLLISLMVNVATLFALAGWAASEAPFRSQGWVILMFSAFGVAAVARLAMLLIPRGK